MFRRAMLAATLAALVLAGCGSSSKSKSTSTAASTSGGGETIQDAMKSLAFTPVTIHATVGQTITWTNDDSPPHNVTYVSGPKFKSSGTLNPGSKFSLKLTQAGTIHYLCTIHPFMKGTIVVGQ